MPWQRGPMTSLPDGDLGALLEYLQERRNFDFRGYKRPSLTRRIAKRMQAVGVEDYQSYRDFLEANPGEFAELFNTILINVTKLLRDPEAWEVLAKEAVAEIAQRKGPDEPIRIWSAGCASGEEAYSLAVLFAEALGEDRFRRTTKIYATDADSDALLDARQGRYRERDLVEALGVERTARFFEVEDGHGTFRGDLRRALIFGRHDLVQDPPISRIDLLVCRNTLMYFTADVQVRVLASFHFALNPGGYLFLGKAEALVTRTNLFEVVDLRTRVFRKDGALARSAWAAPVPRPLVRPRPADTPPGDAADAMAFEQSPVAQFVVGIDGTLVRASRAARRIFSIGSASLGRHVRELDLLYQATELRAALERCLRDLRPVAVGGLSWPVAEQVSTFDAFLAPLEAEAGVLVVLVDVTRYRHLQDDLEQSQRELETAYEEVQSTVEELETTNEELQSTNEELETTNEELHSTNEELETMNEELQSTNEELETSNNELRERSAEVVELNKFLGAVLGGLRSAVVVLGREMDVRAWNRQAEDLWGLRSDEVIGHHFLNLDIGFPVEKVRPAIRRCLAGAGESEHIELTVPAINRRGRAVSCVVRATGLDGDGVPGGVILTMDASPRAETPGMPEASETPAGENGAGAPVVPGPADEAGGRPGDGEAGG